MNMFKHAWIKAKLKFTKYQIQIRDFTHQSHSAYYEYFTDGKNWMYRIYDNATNKVLEEVKGIAAKAETARKEAQIAIHTAMQKYEK